jgi:hypothetical protein
MTRPVINTIARGSNPSLTQAREGRSGSGGHAIARAGECRDSEGLGLITLGEAPPALGVVRDHMRRRELHSDIGRGFVRLLCWLPDEAPIVARVDQLTECNRFHKWASL